MVPRFPSRRHSITFRMTISVCIFLIVSQALLAALVYFYFKREFKQNISEQQFTLLKVVTQNIDQKLSSSLNVIDTVAQQVTAEIVADSDASQHFLDSRSGTHALFDNGLYLFSAQGRIIAESPYHPDRRGLDISFKDYYKKIISSGKPVISEPYHSFPSKGDPAIMFTAPVRDKNGTVIAVLGGSMNLLNGNFLGELSCTRIAETGYLYIMTRSRIMIMHPDKSRIMQGPEIVGINRLLDAALQGFEGSGENEVSQGVVALSSFKSFNTTDWIMGANYPIVEAYKPIHLFQHYMLVAFVAGALLSILIVKLLMERFTNTLVRFAEHVKHIGSKQGDERLFSTDSSDEIGVLAQTFNTMVQHVDQKNAELVHACTHDALTGLYNRAYFDSELDRLARGRQSPISVVVADIDGLKRCNDSTGHAAGDSLIKGAAKILLESFRSEDIVARIGGDEFAVLLPGVGTEQVLTALERVRFAETNTVPRKGTCPLSISLGYTTTNAPEGLMDAFEQADRQMYLEKAARRQANACNI